MTEQEQKPGDTARSADGGSTSNAADTTAIRTKPKRTPAEQRFIEESNRYRARAGQPPLTEQQENLYIDEAYLIGDL